MISEAEERVITDAAMAVIAAKDAKRNQMKLQEVLDEMVHQLDWKGPTGKQMGHIVLGRDDAAVLVREVCGMKVEIKRLQALGPEDDWEERGAAGKMQAEIERLQVALRCISQRATYGIVTPGQKEMADMADEALAHN